MKLIIAEKPIAAKRIAEILSNKKAKKLKKYNVEYYCYDDWYVVPLKGHILNIAFPKNLSNWMKTDLEELIFSNLIYKEEKKNICELLRSLGKEVDEIIIATDYDREGESIGKEALEILKDHNLPVKRIKFSAITEKDVKEAYKNLVEFNYNLADAADARREIDLIWGAVLTRFVSLSSGRLGKNFLSVGRVQTPTLKIVVDREKEILSFKPEKYWVPTIICKKNEIEFKATHKEIKNKSKLFEIKSKFAIIKEIKEKIVKTKPPEPFNTTEFLRVASSIGFSPAEAMNIAESLYMKGYISYPRTDNTVYPETININEKLEFLKKNYDISFILNQKSIEPTKGKKRTTDHPPIHPVSSPNKNDMTEREWKIYDLIARRFLATLSPNLITKRTKITLNVDGKDFNANGVVIVDPGFLRIYPYTKVSEEILPEIKKGEEIEIIKFENVEKETKPKPRYSPSTLIKKMDDLNLGTKSTRAEILQKLINRDYLRGKKSFEPSNIAFSVVNVLEEFSPDITLPDMTSKLEKEMDDIENGKKTKEDVVEDSRKILYEIVKKLKQNKEEISKKFKIALKSDKIIGICPKCGGDLMVLKSKKGKRFVGCSNFVNGCDFTTPLPQRGTIKPTKEVCKVCGCPIVVVKEKGKKEWRLCINPNCESKKKY